MEQAVAGVQRDFVGGVAAELAPKARARAAVAYHAIRRLGYDVRLYDGSCAGWERSGQRVEKQPILRLSKGLNT